MTGLDADFGADDRLFVDAGRATVLASIQSFEPSSATSRICSPKVKSPRNSLARYRSSRKAGSDGGTRAAGDFS
jgi:hypothetical protein